MTTSKWPGSAAARHGGENADLTVMIAAHGALRRDLVALARLAQGPGRRGPDEQPSVAARGIRGGRRDRPSLSYSPPARPSIRSSL